LGPLSGRGHPGIAGVELTSLQKRKMVAWYYKNCGKRRAAARG
jgi:hypothetical protein